MWLQPMNMFARVACGNGEKPIPLGENVLQTNTIKVKKKN